MILKCVSSQNENNFSINAKNGREVLYFIGFIIMKYF